MPRLLLAALLAGAALPTAAGAAEDGPPIQDNSFLLEEAYNQEPGVIQHISAYARVRGDGHWTCSFTEEWPAGGQEHQVSLTFLWLEPEAPEDAGAGVGDLALNYRWQAVGDGAAPVAMAPRLSLIVPTGDEDLGRGAGAWGAQVNLPLSATLGRHAVTHINLGGTFLRGARDAAGNRGDLTTYNLGQSFIWLLRPRLNLMAELAYATGEVVDGTDPSGRFETFVFSPGIRWAHDFRNGLQIVPGIAAPIGIGPSSGTRSLFLYISFEHPLGRKAGGGAGGESGG